MLKRFLKICAYLILFLYIVSVLYNVVYTIIDNIKNDRKAFDFSSIVWKNVLLPYNVASFFGEQGIKVWPGKLLAVFLFAWLIIKKKIKFS